MEKLVAKSLVVGFLLGAGAAQAADVIDQSQTGHDIPFAYLNAGVLIDQTFEPAFSNSVGAGIFLSSGDSFGSSGTVTISLYSGTPGARRAF